MRKHILFIVLCCACLGIGWYARGYVEKENQEDIYQSAPFRRDTTDRVKERPLPVQAKQVRSRPRLSPQHTIDADSVFNAGREAGLDSLRRLFAWYTAPRETLITFDSVGTLLHQSDRLREMEFYTFSPFPQKIVERTITDSFYVPQLPPENQVAVSTISLVGIGATAGAIFGGPLGAGAGGVAGLVADWILW